MIYALTMHGEVGGFEQKLAKPAKPEPNKAEPSRTETPSPR
jgi:hypothetical protein